MDGRQAFHYYPHNMDPADHSHDVAVDSPFSESYSFLYDCSRSTSEDRLDDAKPPRDDVSKQCQTSKW